MENPFRTTIDLINSRIEAIDFAINQNEHKLQMFDHPKFIQTRTEIRNRIDKLSTERASLNTEANKLYEQFYSSQLEQQSLQWNS